MSQTIASSLIAQSLRLLEETYASYAWKCATEELALLPLSNCRIMARSLRSLNTASARNSREVID